MRTMGSICGIERLRAIEDCLSDVIAFQPLAAAGQRFIDDVLQEPLPALRLMEWAAVKDADQLLANGLLVGFAPGIERNCRHVPTPGTLKRRRPLGVRGAACTLTYYN